MTTLGDALDRLHAAPCQPDALRAAFDGVIALAGQQDPEPRDLGECDGALRKVYRAMARLVSEELADALLAAPPEEREGLDRRFEATLHVLRARQQALLVWRSDALSREADDGEGSGWHATVDGRASSEWPGLGASQR